MLKSNFFKILILSLFGIFIFINTEKLTRASDININRNFENALSTAPKGLNWNNDAFTIADFNQAYLNRKKSGTNKGNKSNALVNKYASKINNAKIIQSTNPNNPNTSIIQMTNDTHQTGAVWSNMSKDNYFDVNHEQTASMWIYFGRLGVSHKDSNNNVYYDDTPGDGMAFVIQNDPNGGNSIALSSDGIPVNGQSMGVWGADWDPQNNNINNLSLTAIQNSWALEFDTYVNKNTGNNGSLSGEGTSFDYLFNSAHIAGNYPALNSSYNCHLNTNYAGQYYFNLKHQSNIYRFSKGQNLVDNIWHHITITWKPSANNSNEGTLTYTYDDKDINTGAPIKSDITSSFLIDTNKLGLTDKNKKLYWGFTGSTGKYSENNLIVFESLPSYTDAEVKSNVYDESNNKKITDINNKVDSNSDIKYTFSLNYKGWTKDWDKIKSTMKVPNNIVFTSGTITYPDSPKNKSPRPIPAEVFNNIKDNILQYDLPEKLDGNSRNAEIELHGQAKIAKGDTNLKVPSVHAAFDGGTLMTGTETQAFEIIPKKLTLN